MPSRYAHNKAVKDSDDGHKAKIDYNGHKPVRIATGHIDDVTAADAVEYAKEIEEAIKAEVDEFAVHERGGESIGYATVKDGEFVDWTLYSSYSNPQ